MNEKKETHNIFIVCDITNTARSVYMKKANDYLSTVLVSPAPPKKDSEKVDNHS